MIYSYVNNACLNFTSMTSTRTTSQPYGTKDKQRNLRHFNIRHIFTLTEVQLDNQTGTHTIQPPYFQHTHHPTTLLSAYKQSHHLTFSIHTIPPPYFQHTHHPTTSLSAYTPSHHLTFSTDTIPPPYFQHRHHPTILLSAYTPPHHLTFSTDKTH
jgi:hypothetical protein